MRGSNRAGVNHVVLVEKRLNLCLEVGGILHDPRDDQLPARRPRDHDRFRGALVRVDPAEVEEVITADRLKREFRHRQAVVDGRAVAQAGPPIGVADGHEVPDVVVGAEYLQVLFGREPMNRRHHRRPHETRVGDGQEVEMVVDEVKFASAFEGGGDVQALIDLGVQRRVLRIARRGDRNQPGRGERIPGGEEGHVHAAPHEALRQR